MKALGIVYCGGVSVPMVNQALVPDTCNPSLPTPHLDKDRPLMPV